MARSTRHSRAQSATPTAPRVVHQFSTIAMDTWVVVQVVSPAARAALEPAATRALDWFSTVEAVCSRFDDASELRRLCARAGVAVQVSPLLLELTDFALTLARLTDGAFDPTVGAAMEQHGFNQNYRTGERRAPRAPGRPTTYRDVRVNRGASTVTLRKPLLLDLGAVAKGLAIDLAARELLSSALDFSVDAGGDLCVHGSNARGEPWEVGIQHPRAPGLLSHIVRLADAALCTSGDYERAAPDGTGHHILDPRASHSPGMLASASVIAPSALVADGLSTAAMILGPQRALRLLEREGVQGFLLDGDGASHVTSTGFGLNPA